MAPMDLSDRVFGRLTVLNRADRVRYWVCRCSCGTQVEVRANSLTGGLTRSCGCISRENMRELGKARTTHGQFGTRLYNVWQNMIARCYNPNNDAYDNYGGRGIRVCKAWKEFTGFADWAVRSGYREGLFIDRRENDLHYTPSNCRWTTRTVNNNNKRNNVYLKVFNEEKSTADWARDPRCVVGYHTLRKRIRDGWQPKTAITTPVLHG